mgnify:CR=1 FL=1
MKSYIKPEVKVYKVRIEPLLSGSEGGQIGMGLVKKYDPSLFDEENDDGQTGRGGLWDDEDFED